MNAREFGKRRLKIKRKTILSNENNELRIDRFGVPRTLYVKENSHTDEENLCVWLFSFAGESFLL